MVQAGFLLEEEREELEERPLQVVTPPAPRGSWTVSAAIEEVEEQLGEGSILAQSLTVYTSLNPLLQTMAEDAVMSGLQSLAEQHPQAVDAQAALVAIRVSDGSVLAMVGGRDPQQGSFNRAMHSRRHIGSTVKPLTALIAFEQDLKLSPSSTFLDAPIIRELGGGRQWEPRNHDQKWAGEITLRQAIAQSRNIPAILLAEEVGLESLATHWRRLGLTGAEELPSAALGAFEGTPLELAAAYTTIPGAGNRVEPIWVLDVLGEDQNQSWMGQGESRRMVSARAAFLTQEILQEVARTGTGRRLSKLGLTGEIGGKTGTTDEARDAWFAGITPEVAVVVWVGLDRGEGLGLGGATAALPIWAQFISDAGLNRGQLPGPLDVEEVLICPDTREAWRSSCPPPETDWFSLEGVPGEPCWLHSEQVDAVMEMPPPP
jgi:penicillin-binding protein 1B